MKRFGWLGVAVGLLWATTGCHGGGTGGSGGDPGSGGAAAGTGGSVGGAAASVARFDTGQDEAFGIAVDASGVYFTAKYTVGRMDPDGSNVQILATESSPTSYPYDLVLDDSTIYYQTFSGLHRIPKTGGTPEELVHVGVGSGAGLTMNDDRLYLVGHDSEIDPAPTSHVLLSVKKDGSDRQDLVKTHDEFLGVAVDDLHVYYGGGPTGAIKIFRANKDGSDNTAIATPHQDCFFPQLDASKIVCCGNGIYSVETGSGAIDYLYKLSPATLTSSVAIGDGGKAYTLVYTPPSQLGHLVEVGPGRTLVDGIDGPIRVAYFAGVVYVAEQHTGKILRVEP